MKMHTLKIHAPATLGRLLIAHSLPRFVHMHPELRVQMRDSSPSRQTLAHDADAAICIGSFADSDLITQQLGAVRFTTCASPEFIERNGLPCAPADIAPSDCIALLEPGAHRVQNWLFRKGKVTHTISPAGPLAFSDADAAVAAAVRGGGYVRVLSIEADQRIAAGLLRPVLEDWNEESQPISIAHSRDCIAGDALLAFAAFVTSVLPLMPAENAIR